MGLLGHLRLVLTYEFTQIKGDPGNDINPRSKHHQTMANGSRLRPIANPSLCQPLNLDNTKSPAIRWNASD